MRRKRTKKQQALAIELHAFLLKLIDSYMQKHKLTHTAFARKCGISTVVLRRIRKGPTTYADDTFPIARGIDMSPWDLLGEMQRLAQLHWRKHGD